MGNQQMKNYAKDMILKLVQLVQVNLIYNLSNFQITHLHSRAEVAKKLAPFLCIYITKIITF